MAAANNGKPSMALRWAPRARKSVLYVDVATLPFRKSRWERGRVFVALEEAVVMAW